MKDVLLLKNKSISIGLSFDDITARLDAKKVSYDVYENEIPANSLSNYRSCILYGKLESQNQLEITNLCYIPDPDLDSGTIKDIDLLLKDLNDKISSIKKKFSFITTFSLFTNETSQNFAFLAPDREKSVKPFNLCLVADNSYKENLPKILFSEPSVMMIYIGTENKECEEEINTHWKNYPNLSLSTFQEPVSFIHANLAKEILIDFESLDFSSEIQVLKEFKFSDVKLTSIREKLLKLSVITKSNFIPEKLN